MSAIIKPYILSALLLILFHPDDSFSMLANRQQHHFGYVEQLLLAHQPEAEQKHVHAILQSHPSETRALDVFLSVLHEEHTVNPSGQEYNREWLDNRLWW
jgi:hypothetical protein